MAPSLPLTPRPQNRWANPRMAEVVLSRSSVRDLVSSVVATRMCEASPRTCPCLRSSSSKSSNSTILLGASGCHNHHLGLRSSTTPALRRWLHCRISRLLHSRTSISRKLRVSTIFYVYSFLIIIKLSFKRLDSDFNPPSFVNHSWK